MLNHRWARWEKRDFLPETDQASRQQCSGYPAHSSVWMLWPVHNVWLSFVYPRHQTRFNTSAAKVVKKSSIKTASNLVRFGGTGHIFQAFSKVSSERMVNDICMSIFSCQQSRGHLLSASVIIASISGLELRILNIGIMVHIASRPQMGIVSLVTRSRVP